MTLGIYVISFYMEGSCIEKFFLSISLHVYDNLHNLAGEIYQQTDMDFLDAERDSYRDDGSTASTAVLVGNHLYVANVGDSRAVISKAGKGIKVLYDLLV